MASYGSSFETSAPLGGGEESPLVEQKGQHTGNNSEKAVTDARSAIDNPLGGEVNGEDKRGGTDAARRQKQGLTAEILSLALPALVSLCVDPLMSAIDTAYVGRLSPDQGGGEIGLGVLGLNTTVFFTAFYMFVFLATVPTPFVASARARGDEVGASRIIGQLLTFALLLGLVLTLTLEFAAPAILHIMGATEINAAEAASYLRSRALSAPAVLILSVGNGAFRGFLDTRTPLLITLGANVVNFVLDPILIFYAGLGVDGAAIATATAEWCGALVFLYLLSKKEPSIKPLPLSLTDSDVMSRELGEVATSSAAVLCRAMALQLFFVAATAFASRVDSLSIAAHQVVAQFWIITAFMADSLGVAAQGLIADRMGLGRLLEAREVARRVLLMGALWGLVELAVIGAFGGTLSLAFTSDEKVLSTAAPIVLIVAAMQPINSYMFIGDGVLQGSQDFVYEAITMVLNAVISITYILFRWQWAHDSGAFTLVDVWTGVCILSSTRAVTFSFRHFLDPRGPLAVPVSAAPGGTEGEKGIRGGDSSDYQKKDQGVGNGC